MGSIPGSGQREETAAGRKAAVICAEETRGKYPEGKICCIGSRQKEETIAAQLYDTLRNCDGEGIDVIYAETFRTPRLGEAIMNRLVKAAGHNIITGGIQWEK